MYHRLRLIAAVRRAKQDAKDGKDGQNPYDDPALRRRYYRSYVAWRDIYKERTPKLSRDAKRLPLQRILAVNATALE